MTTPPFDATPDDLGAAAGGIDLIEDPDHVPTAEQPAPPPEWSWSPGGCGVLILGALIGTLLGTMASAAGAVALAIWVGLSTPWPF